MDRFIKMCSYGIVNGLWNFTGWNEFAKYQKTHLDSLTGTSLTSHDVVISKVVLIS